MSELFEQNTFSVIPSPTNKLLVLGVGGAGGNAINSMILSQDCPCVEFIAANTDAQVLVTSKASVTIQLGSKITKGSGAGANPDTGRRAAEEDIEEIKKNILGADILFLAAGLGGGTGSGALPVIAKAAKEMGILTVAVVTTPFAFEGRRRVKHAEEALQSLKNSVDSMIIVSNDKLLESVAEKISLSDAFAISNTILKQSVKGISDIIQKTGLINVDFADVRAIMKETGVAIMGTGRASGDDRARKAAYQAINSPLLESVSIEGAKGILFNVTGNVDLGLHEINDAAKIIYGMVNDEANIILGSVIDENMGDEIMITIIATGLSFERKAEIPRPIIFGGNDVSRLHQNPKQQNNQSTETFGTVLGVGATDSISEGSKKLNTEESAKNRIFPFF